MSAKQTGRKPARAASRKEDKARLTNELVHALTRLQQMAMADDA